jgi:hypothetical protein
MFTATQVKEVINYNTEDLTLLIRKTYPRDSFVSSEFLGVSNGGSFVFSAVWFNEEEERDEVTKVFVRSESGELSADY